MNLSEHFTLREFEATRHILDNTMPPSLYPNAIALCQNVLEPARVALGPIYLSSGYRCPKLNLKVLGQPKSQHLFGQAADIIPLAEGVSVLQLMLWLNDNADFDQLIYEFGRWVHVSYALGREQRRDVRMAVSGGKKTQFLPLTRDELAALAS